MTATPDHDDKLPEPLIDLTGLFAGLRWRRRLCLSFAGVGLLIGLVAALVVPSPTTAATRIFVVHEDSDNGESVMATDLAILETTTVAAEAVQRLGIDLPPEQFVTMYSGDVVAAGVLEIIARGVDDRQAVERAKAVADAFIAVHIKQSEEPAQAEATALTDRRSKLQDELDGINAQIGRVTTATDQLQPLLDRRATLSRQIAELTGRAEDATLGSPRVVAGTRIIDAPRPNSRSAHTSLVLFAGGGLFLGLGLGIAVALVAAVARSRPVLRRDIAHHLGASVIAQLPAPLRGLRRLSQRSGAEKERQRTTATLIRTVRAGTGPVSLLELGCPGTAAQLAVEIAEGLAASEPVVLIDDLPGHEVQGLRRLSANVRVIDGRQFPQAGESNPGGRRIAVGTVGPGAPWTDLHRLAADALVVVRAGGAEAAWMHTVARQLADADILVIGVVVVHPDPRDRSDGTLWDAFHFALRGRATAAQRLVTKDATNGAAPARTVPSPVAAPRPTVAAPVHPTPVAVPEETVRIPSLPPVDGRTSWPAAGAGAGEGVDEPADDAPDAQPQYGELPAADATPAEAVPIVDAAPTTDRVSTTDAVPNGEAVATDPVPDGGSAPTVDATSTVDTASTVEDAADPTVGPGDDAALADDAGAGLALVDDAVADAEAPMPSIPPSRSSTGNITPPRPVPVADTTVDLSTTGSHPGDEPDDGGSGRLPDVPGEKRHRPRPQLRGLRGADRPGDQHHPAAHPRPVKEGEKT